MARGNNCMDRGKAIIIIFGLDKNDKPRAARFRPEDREAATTAASLMGLSVARAKTTLGIVTARQPTRRPSI